MRAAVPELRRVVPAVPDAGLILAGEEAAAWAAGRHSLETRKGRINGDRKSKPANGDLSIRSGK